MTSSTSISGMKLISGSSRHAAAAQIHRPRSVTALAVDDLDELDRLLFHLDDQRVDLRAEMAVEDQRGNRDDDAERRVVERDRDAVRELDRVAARRRSASRRSRSCRRRCRSSPSSGAIAAMVPSVVRKRSRSCVTARPTSSIASFITGRGAFTLASPAARMRPSGPCAAVLAEQLRRRALLAGTRRARGRPGWAGPPQKCATTTGARRSARAR